MRMTIMICFLGRDSHPKRRFQCLFFVLSPFRLLTAYFNIETKYDSRRGEIAISFHFYNYAFCKEQAFTCEQISTFMSIMCAVFHRDERAQNEESMTSSFRYFKDLLLRHSVQRPPISVGVFNSDADSMNSILDFALTSYFRQFNLYKYIFNEKIRLVLNQSYPNEILSIPSAGDLSDAMEVKSRPNPS